MLGSSGFLLGVVVFFFGGGGGGGGSFVVVVVSLAAAAAEEDDTQWLVQFGSSKNDDVARVAVAGERIYAGGVTLGALSGEEQQRGFGDVWLWSDAGWSRQLGSGKSDELGGLAATGEALYAAGSTYGDWDDTQASRQRDGWRGKFDPGTGEPLWPPKVFGSAKKDDVAALGVLLAPPEEEGAVVFIGGTTYGDIFDHVNQGQGDAWIARFDDDQHVQWSVVIATARSETLTDLKAEGSSVVACGTTFGDLDGADPHRGRGDAWVQMLEARTGTVQWTTTVGTALGDEATAVAILDGDVFVVGTTFGHFEFETQFGGRDAFASRLDRLTGEVQWTRLLGSDRVDFANAVAVFGDSLYVAGLTYGRVARPNLGKSDAWLAVLDRPSGQVNAQVQFGHLHRDSIDALAVGGVFYDDDHPTSSSSSSSSSEAAEGRRKKAFLVAAGATDGHFGACNAGLKDVWIARIPTADVVSFFSQFDDAFHDRRSLECAGDDSALPTPREEL